MRPNNAIFTESLFRVELNFKCDGFGSGPVNYIILLRVLLEFLGTLREYIMHIICNQESNFSLEFLIELPTEQLSCLILLFPTSAYHKMSIFFHSLPEMLPPEDASSWEWWKRLQSTIYSLAGEEYSLPEYRGHISY